ncbi:hypothetical protein SZ00_03589 [Rhodococcus sp. AD45]|nr:hypothetical protein SZ00_03589 [Rhodococcus sp. AD45]
MYLVMVLVDAWPVSWASRAIGRTSPRVFFLVNRRNWLGFGAGPTSFIPRAVPACSAEHVSAERKFLLLVQLKRLRFWLSDR